MSGNLLQSHLNKSRADKFSLVMTLPPGLKTINKSFQRNNKSINLDSLQFSVFGTVLPDIVVPAIETKYTGGNIYISSHARPPYPAVSVGFTIDNQFNNYWVIYQWLNLMRDQFEGEYGIVNTRKLADPATTLKDYSTTFSLFCKDEMEQQIIKFEYHHAFPTKLGALNYDYKRTEELTCSFEFVFSNITAILLPML